MAKGTWEIFKSLWDWIDRIRAVVLLIPGASLVISIGAITTFVSGVWVTHSFAEIIALTTFVALCLVFLLFLTQLILDRIGRPRLTFSFDPKSTSCVASVAVQMPNLPFNAPLVPPFVRQAVYYRAMVELKSRHPLRGCRGFLKSVYRETASGDWAPTALRDALDLRWATRDFNPIELRPNIPQYLDLFWIDEVDRIIALPVHHTSNSTTDVFKNHDRYRLDVVLSDEAGRSWPLSIGVKQTEEWNSPLVDVLSASSFTVS